MPNLIRIQDTEIEIVEYHGQRVVTAAMVDHIHKRPVGTANAAFNRNKERFDPEKHFYRLTYQELNVSRIIENPPPNGLTLFTERGYMRLCKIFNDDLAWDVFEEMEKVYFGEKPIPQLTQAELTLQIAQNQVEHERRFAAVEQRQDKQEEIQELHSHIIGKMTGDDGFWSILYWRTMTKNPVPEGQEKRFGMIAKNLCIQRELDYVRDKPHPVYGSVNGYPPEIIEEAYNILMSLQ